jgi:DUF1680 family protein
MVMHKTITRRHLLAASLPLATGLADGATERRVGKDAVRLMARPFALGSVTLSPGPIRDLMEANRQYLHHLESDRLLHMFRVTAGLPSSAEPLAGWERPDIELRGHFVGHYLSACALMAASARDEALKAKGAAMVAEMAKCQKALGSGYLSAFPAEFFDRLRDGLPVWAPWYTIHKVMAGMADQYTHCGNHQALDVAESMAGWCRRWAAQLDDPVMARTLEVEHGGMNEVLVNLYDITGKRDYLETARRFEHRRIVDPLAEERDQLKGLHANTQIPKIIGAARFYELTGDPRYRRIAEFFWRQVTAHRCYATGGTSNVERWRTGPDQLSTELSDTTEECCCTYNMLKLTRQVFGWTADARCADYYERAFFNGIVGTMNPADATTMYYVPLASGYWKMFSTPRRSFWCCTGSGVESFSKLADSIYFHDDRGLWVSLFVASQLEWPEKGLKIRQETSFPDEEGTSFVFTAERPVDLELRIRTPYWAARGIAVKVNGQAQPGESKPGSYRTVSRTWKTGDKVEVSLPMSLHAHPMPDDQSLQAFLYGPLVLAGELGTEGVTAESTHGDPLNARGGKYLRGLPTPAPEFHAPPGKPSDWIPPAPGRKLAFSTTGQSKDVTLVPLNRLFDQRYAVYWRVRPS